MKEKKRKTEDYLKPLIPVYFDSEQLENLISFYGQYFLESESFKKTSNEKETQVQLTGKASLKVPSWIPIFGENGISTEANANRNANKNSQEELRSTLFRTKFSLLYDLIRTLSDQNLLKKVYTHDDFTKVENYDIVEFPVTVLKQSLVDLILAIQKMILYYSISQDSEFIAKFQTGNLESNYAKFLGVLSDLGTELTKSNTLEIPCKLDSTGINPILLCEKKLFIGDTDKLTGNEYKVLGKVVSIKQKGDGEYNTVDSTIFSILGDRNMKEIEKLLNTLISTIKSGLPSKNNIEDINFSDLIFVKSPAFKIIPIAMYV